MKLLIDALSATPNSGGMQAYAESLLPALATTKDVRCAILSNNPEHFRKLAPTARHLGAPSDSSSLRVLSQSLYTPLVARRFRPDALLSLNPVISPLVPTLVTSCVVHDWRHLKENESVGILQNAYRQAWQATVRRATITFCISSKTAQETTDLIPSANVKLAQNGSDHAHAWFKDSDRPTRSDHVLAFGHHSNKRPELSLRAFAQAVDRLPDNITLVIVGLPTEERARLADIAKTSGTAGRIKLHGRLDEREYRYTMASARAVLMPSSDEGFGLPVVEASEYSVPVITTTDSGLATIHDNLAAVVNPTVSDIASALLQIVTEGAQARPVGGAVTWQQTANQMVSDLRQAASL